MSISKESKKKVEETWLKAFPQLNKFSGSRFFKIIGPFIAGIELLNAWGVNNYKPYFVLYPLWENNIDKCLDKPIVLNTLRNKKGISISLPYEWDDKLLGEFIANLGPQILLSLNKDVFLTEVSAAIDLYWQDPGVKAQSSHMRAHLLSSSFFAALYVNNRAEVERILASVLLESQSWNMQNFIHFFGDFQSWLDGLYMQIGKRDEFISKIKGNGMHKKIKDLQFSELVV